MKHWTRGGVLLLAAALHHVMQDVPPEEMGGFRDRYLRHMEDAAAGLCRHIDQTGQLSQEELQSILDEARAFLARDRAGRNAG